MILIYSLALVVLIILSFFFSSADMAFGSVSSDRIEKYSLDNPKSKSLRRAARLSKRYDKTISTILLFNDTINAGLDVVATLLGMAIAEEVFKGSTINPELVEFYGLIASLIALVVKIIFGEIIAKSLGKIFNYKIVKLYSQIIEVCYYITWPITFLVGGLGNIISRPVTSSVSDKVTGDDELHEMVDEIEDAGQIDETKADIIRGTIDYATTVTYEIMTPRARIYAIDKERTLEDILDDERTFKHSRIPVYEENIDNIIGYVKSKDLIKLKLENKEEYIDSIIRSVSFFPRTIEINDLLIYFRKNKEHIAIILDEYGGVEGLVSLEDILEEIVGEIWDETDNPNDEVVERNDGSFIIDGSMNLEDFCDYFDLDFDELETEYVTVGGLIIELLDDNFANVNDVVNFENLTMKVIALGKHHTVKKVIVTVHKKEEE